MYSSSCHIEKWKNTENLLPVLLKEGGDTGRAEKLIGKAILILMFFFLWTDTFSCFVKNVWAAAKFLSANSSVGGRVFQPEKMSLYFWHQVCLLTSMFLNRNREPRQLRQRGSTHPRDRWLSRGEDQIITVRSVFASVQIHSDYIYTPPLTHTHICTHKPTAIKTIKEEQHLNIFLKTVFVLIWIIVLNVECVIREKEEP